MFALIAMAGLILYGVYLTIKPEPAIVEPYVDYIQVRRTTTKRTRPSTKNIFQWTPSTEWKRRTQKKTSPTTLHPICGTTGPPTCPTPRRRTSSTTCTPPPTCFHGLAMGGHEETTPTATTTTPTTTTPMNTTPTTTTKEEEQQLRQNSIMGDQEPTRTTTGSTTTTKKEDQRRQNRKRDHRSLIEKQLINEKQTEQRVTRNARNTFSRRHVRRRLNRRTAQKKKQLSKGMLSTLASKLNKSKLLLQTITTLTIEKKSKQRTRASMIKMKLKRIKNLSSINPVLEEKETKSGDNSKVNHSNLRRSKRFVLGNKNNKIYRSKALPYLFANLQTDLEIKGNEEHISQEYKCNLGNCIKISHGAGNKETYETRWKRIRTVNRMNKDDYVRNNEIKTHKPRAGSKETYIDTRLKGTRTFYKINKDDDERNNEIETYEPRIVVSQKPVNILIWDPSGKAPYYSEKFYLKNCEFQNCYVTTNQSHFGEEFYKFDIIIFKGPLPSTEIYSYLPQIRYTHQKYVFLFLESAANYPICNEEYDDVFNITCTYKLDSDIPNPYFVIMDKNGQVVGPKTNMEWVNRTIVGEEFSQDLKRKTKTAAGFISNCKSYTRSRKIFIKRLKSALNVYNLTADIYGTCGTYKCARNDPECDRMIQRDYYFYLSVENSLSEDYVTEKLLTALNNFAIPVVYGAANYSRFLPPKSYLDGKSLKPEDLAKTMHRLIMNPDEYKQYFWWRNHYSYVYALGNHSYCNLCEAFNNKTLMEIHESHKYFRKWWNYDFDYKCRQ